MQSLKLLYRKNTLKGYCFIEVVVYEGKIHTSMFGKLKHQIVDMQVKVTI